MLFVIEEEGWGVVVVVVVVVVFFVVELSLKFGYLVGKEKEGKSSVCVSFVRLCC